MSLRITNPPSGRAGVAPTPADGRTPTRRARLPGAPGSVPVAGSGPGVGAAAARRPGARSRSRPG